MNTVASSIAGRERLLIVDDEAVIRNLAELMLQKLGYTVVCAEDGLQALEYYERHWQDIDLVIADMSMPNMGGLECLRALKAVNPGLKAIRQLTPGSEEQILCAAVITMAHNLGLQVVAEGVETAVQVALLKELGCDHAQGYYFSPAVSAAEFKQLLLKQSA